MKLINIKMPYWGAWKEFGWDKGVWGIGLQKRYLEGSSFLRIYSEYHNLYYQVDLGEARKVAKIGKNKPKGVTLFIIPMDILRPEVSNGNKMVGERKQAKKVKEAGKETRKETQGELF
jgi:hypothetical protein